MTVLITSGETLDDIAGDLVAAVMQIITDGIDDIETTEIGIGDRIVRWTTPEMVAEWLGDSERRDEVRVALAERLAVHLEEQ